MLSVGRDNWRILQDYPYAETIYGAAAIYYERGFWFFGGYVTNSRVGAYTESRGNSDIIARLDQDKTTWRFELSNFYLTS